MTNVVIGRLSYPAYTGGIDRNLAAATGSRYSVKAGQENFPVVQINWSRAARFVNWLANGQGSGGTESGVYDMSVFNSNAFATPPSRAAIATVFLPSENEYYKAAQYDPATNGGVGGYWQYGTRSDTAPASIGPPGTANSANIGAGTTGASGNTVALTMATTGSTFDQNSIYLTNVGAYTAAKSYYSLFDVDGLVYNWTEASRENRSVAGPGLMNGGLTAVPEPATWAPGACGLVACVLGRIRKATHQPGKRRALHRAVRSSYGSGRGVRREGDSR